jgi:hypothetical protein
MQTSWPLYAFSCMNFIHPFTPIVGCHAIREHPSSACGKPATLAFHLERPFVYTHHKAICFIDPTTELLNRNKMILTTRRVAKAEGSPSSTLMLNLNHFPRQNVSTPKPQCGLLFSNSSNMELSGSRWLPTERCEQTLDGPVSAAFAGRSFSVC